MSPEVEIINDALQLLEAPLVWSSDFEAIRWHLAALLTNEIRYSLPCQAAIDLAVALVDDFQNDVTVDLG